MRPDRDDPLGPVIRETLQASRTDCPDAETIAAYAERVLASAERRGVEQHLSTCSRCRETLLLMDRAEEKGTATIFQEAKKGGSPLYRWPWLAAAAAAALATVIWLRLPADVRAPEVAQFATRDLDKEKPSAPSEQAPAKKAPVEADQAKSKAEPARPESAAPPAGVAAPSPPPAAFRERAKAAEERRDEDKLGDMRQRRARTGQPAAAPEAPPPAAPSARAPAPQRESIATDTTSSALMARQNREYIIASGGKRGSELASAAPAVTWRVWVSGVVERSADGGATWTREQGVDALGARAVASPSADVCWIVGDNGLILRFEAGRGWTRVTPPAQIAFVAIEASDARNATITAADTRRFTTTDGGRTWK